MYKQTQKWLALTIAVVLLLSLFTGCGASSADSAAYEAAPAAEAPMEEMAMEDSVAAGAGFDGEYAYTEEGEAIPANEATKESDFTEKIIYTGYLYVETTEFDAGLAALDAMVSQYGGFLENSDISGYTMSQDDGTTVVVDRYACYVIRIPCDKFDEFMDQAGSVGNVVNNSKTAQNITSQFTDTEAYLESLQVQEERLMAMMEQATDVESLIALEARLAEVRYEIESATRQLRNWQNQIDYSTVTVNLQEVAVYTPTASNNRTFGERMADAFSDGWHSFGRTLASLLVGLVSVWPALLLLAVIAAVIVLLVKRSNKKAAQRRQALYEAQQAATKQQTPEE